MLDAASLGRYGSFIVGEGSDRGRQTSVSHRFFTRLWEGYHGTVFLCIIAVEGPTRPRAQRSTKLIKTIRLETGKNLWVLQRCGHLPLGKPVLAGWAIVFCLC